jgi:hypothetical protein
LNQPEASAAQSGGDFALFLTRAATEQEADLMGLQLSEVLIQMESGNAPVERLREYWNL